MISKLYIAESRTFSAPDNLATESMLTGRAARGEMILFLWQNERTVVIGRNQNAWKECRLESLNRDGGTLVRRLSGGGAVFHDLGNLNVSFCVPRSEEDIPRQTQVMLSALRSLGVQAARSGRNDLEIDGRKFSGHAFYRQGAASCHHATLMLKVAQEALEKYLRVSPLKLRSRGVDSVRTRVANLTDLYPGLTLSSLCEALEQAFSETYRLRAESFSWEDMLTEADCARQKAERERFASWEWTFGRRIPFDLEEQERFPWGEVDLQLHVENGRIHDCKCYTDAMDPVWTEEMEEALKDVRFTPEDVHTAFSALQTGSDPRMKADLEALLLKMTQK